MKKEDIKSDIKKAMLAKKQPKLLALRNVEAEIMRYEKMKEGNIANDSVVDGIIRKLISQRKDSISQFTGRQDLIDKEQAEIDILKEYLPPDLTEDEIKEVINLVKRENTTLTGKPLFGKIMKEIAGRAEASKVEALMQ